MPVNRREFLYVSSAAALAIPARSVLSAAGLVPFTAQAPPPAQPSFETVRGSVGIFSGKGGTIGWLANKDGLVVVDSQFPDTAQICLDGLKQKSGRSVDVFVNTHHHADHTGGNRVFSDAKKMVAHRNVPDLQRKGAPAGQADQQVVATTLFDKEWTETVGGERVSARHYGPAHTGGDAVIYFQKANVAHMGDLLFHERHPFVDRPGGASIQNWLKLIETVAKELPADAIYIAGHAKTGLPVTVDRAALLRQRDYFDAVLTHVRRGIADKKSREEVTRLEALPKFEDHMSAPPRLTLASVLGVAYDELTAA